MGYQFVYSNTNLTTCKHVTIFSVKETQTTTEIMVSLTIGAFGQNLAEDLYTNYEDKKKKKKGKGNTIWQGTCTFRNGASI